MKPISSTTFTFPGNEYITVNVYGPGNAGIDSNLKRVAVAAEYNAAIDGMESLLLALASEGLYMDGPSVKNAVQTAFKTIGRLEDNRQAVRGVTT